MLIFGTKRLLFAAWILLVFLVLDLSPLKAELEDGNGARGGTNHLLLRRSAPGDINVVNKKGIKFRFRSKPVGYHDHFIASNGVRPNRALTIYPYYPYYPYHTVYYAHHSDDDDAAAREYLDGVPRPNMGPNDPPDNVINSKLKYQGATIYKKNPCANFREDLGSKKNKGRKKGCRKAADHFKKKAKEVPSAKCPDPGNGRCFAVANMTGRCYITVDFNDFNKTRFELINNC